MLFYRYFGIQVLALGTGLKSVAFEQMTNSSLELVRLYFPELFVLSILKCKKKLWKLTVNNIDDLYANLCHKIDFDRFKANAIALNIHHKLQLKNPLFNYDRNNNKEIQNLIGDWGEEWKVDEVSWAEYVKIRSESISSLIQANISPDNLDFGGFFDRGKETFNALFKGKI